MRNVAALFVAALSLTAARPGRADDPPAAERTISGVVVDERGSPVAGVPVETIRGEGGGTSIGTTGEDGRFEFSAPADEAVRVRAIDPSTPRIGWKLYPKPGEAAGDDETKSDDPAGGILLRPARKIAVRVIDAEGSAVPNATAEVHWTSADGGSYLSLPTYGTTSPDGTAAFFVPTAASIDALIAFKSGIGFDYLDDSPDRHSRPVGELPDEIPLTLDGASTIRVRVVGEDGDPIVGSPVAPWLIHKTGYRREANVSGSRTLTVASGADGVATFDWIPAAVERGVPFLDRSSGDLHSPDWVSTDPKSPDAELTMRLLTRVAVSGRVTRPDGSPAGGIGVSAEGSGHAHFEDRQTASTNAEGIYTLKVAPEQAYVVTAADRDWTSESRVVAVLPGEPVEAVDFVLRQPTVVRGRVTIGPDRRPVPDEYLQMHRPAGLLPDAIQKLAKDGSHRSVGSFFHGKTDAEGRFEFQVGPGEYVLSGPPHAGRAEFTVTDQAEVVHDFHMEREVTGPLLVRVVDADGKPVAGAKVNGTYASSEAHRSFRQQVTDAEGKFETTRSLDPLVLHAVSGDGALGGLARSEAEESETTVTLGPTTSATGRGLDHEGNPLTERELRFGVRVHMGDPKNSPFTDAFGGTVTTDVDGRYTLFGLIAGQTYHVSSYDPPYFRRVADVKVEGAAPIELGETRLSAPSQPYVPPTAEKRLADALDAKADVPVAVRLEELVAEADREYTRPLLLFTKPGDPAAVELYRLFNEEPEAEAESGGTEEGDESGARPATPRELRWEFELAALNVDRPGVPDTAAWAGVKSGDGGPALVTTDVGGQLSAVFPLTLGADGKLDRDALAAFLASQKLPTRDAERMLAEALAKATAEEKRVFLIASASWCGPCRLLARFLAPHKEELDKHYVFVKLDVSRDEHADAVRDRYQADRKGGVPWFVVLGADGTVQATSNMPDSAPEFAGENIGFPSEPACVEYFLGVLRDTAPRLSDDALAAVREAFADRK